MVDVPLPTLEMVAIAVVFYLAGAATPTYYANERLRGFGRAIAAKLPYQPPPGMDTEQAMRASVQQAAEVHEEGETGEGGGEGA